MNQEDRRKMIVDRLEKQGACSYPELIDMLGASNMTVRRDVDRLVEQGLAYKTLGGIQKANAPASFYESNVVSRLSSHTAEKKAIALAALECLEPSQTIFLDGSTTCLELAKVLALKCRGLTIVTNSALICLELGRNNENRIIGIGGQYDPDSLSFVGPTSEDEAGKFFVDLAFMSTKGFLPEEGTFESSVANFRVKQIMARQSDRVVLLADHSKFGKRALCKVLDVTQIHTVITDVKPGDEDLAHLHDRVKSVVVASLDKIQQEVATGVS